MRGGFNRGYFSEFKKAVPEIRTAFLNKSGLSEKKKKS